MLLLRGQLRPWSAALSRGRCRRGGLATWKSLDSDVTEFEHLHDNAVRGLLPRPAPGGFARGSFISWRPEKDGAVNGLEDLYEIVGKVGEGGFGIVYSARHRRTGEVVAIKAIRKDKFKVIGDLMSEIDFLKVADHPNVIRYYETLQDKENHYLVMEMCSGGSLSDLLKTWHEEGAPSIQEKDFARIVVQMLRGLAYCHRHSIVHRDVKPSNFLFGCGKPKPNRAIPIACSGETDAPLKLVDFGISGVVRRDQPGKRMLTRRAGTEGYIAPEVLLGQPYGSSADLFSVGAVFHKMVTGVPLSWNAETAKYKFPGQVRWMTLSKEGRSLLERLLDSTPEARPTASEAIDDPWFQALNLSIPAGIDASYIDECIRNVFSFGKLSKLQRSIMYSTVAFAPLHCHEMEKLRLAFMAVDREHNGKLSVEDFVRLSEQAGLSMKEARQVFTCVNASKSGDISYSEWLAAAAPEDWYCHPEYSQRAFSTLDLDRNGWVSAEHICYFLPDVFDKETIAAELCRLFPHGDGRMTFEDFCHLMCHRSPS